MQRNQLIAGAACALVAVAAVFVYTASIGSEAQVARAAALKKYGGEQVEVLVAKADIDAGTTIEKSDVTRVSWLVDLLPDADVATSTDQVTGQVAGVNIKKGELLLLERIGSEAARINVPSNLEAVSVASDDVLAVGGAIKAGSVVDVYVESTGGSIALLGQNILVLETSVLGEDADDDEEVTWVTLAVTPESVSELMRASAKGTIHFALPGDQGSDE